jgi:hypothetical protein
MSTRHLVPLLLTTLVTGCIHLEADPPPPPPPSEVATSALEPHFSARAYEGSMRILARFSTTDADFVRLTASDRVVASIDGAAEIEMRETVQGREVRYVAELPAPAKGVRVAIRLYRKASMASATASEIVVPAPFQLVETPSSIAANGRVVVRTLGLDGEADLTANAGCLDGVFVNRASYEEGTLIVDNVGARLATNVSECAADFEVSVETTGSVDPIFAKPRGAVAQVLDPIGFEGGQRRSFRATVTSR